MFPKIYHSEYQFWEFENSQWTPIHSKINIHRSLRGFYDVSIAQLSATKYLIINVTPVVSMASKLNAGSKIQFFEVERTMETVVDDDGVSSQRAVHEIEYRISQRENKLFQVQNSGCGGGLKSKF